MYYLGNVLAIKFKNLISFATTISQYAERDLNKTSNTLTETLTELFLMA